MLTERRLGRTRWILWVLILLAIGVAAGAERIWLSDFLAINGDFQNYNVLRRFLDGQVPYRDFTNYLGMGVLGISCITNMATGIAKVPHTHEQVVKIANEASDRLCGWVK